MVIDSDRQSPIFLRQAPGDWLLIWKKINSQAWRMISFIRSCHQRIHGIARDLEYVANKRKEWSCLYLVHIPSVQMVVGTLFGWL